MTLLRSIVTFFLLATFSVTLSAQEVDRSARELDPSEQEFDINDLRNIELKRYAKLAKAEQFTLASAKDYDVTWYGLDLTFPSQPSGRFYGSISMDFNSLVDGLDLAELNMADFMRADSVFIDDVLLEKSLYTHADDIISITLPATMDTGDDARMRIVYSSPYAGSAVSYTAVRNVDLDKDIYSISSQAEPYDARRWWPCKDDPADKADSLDLHFTVDEEVYPVGNGLVVSDVNNGDGTRTVHWKSLYPIVTYLVSIAAAEYNYRELEFTHSGKTMPVGSWWYGMSSANMAVHEATMLEGLKVYSDLFTPYPFLDEKYGMAEYYSWAGAMEHQTVSSMRRYGTDIVVHELMHQWFGDKVTCGTFEHIWLNEGWATYGEALFAESRGGLNALKAKMAGEVYYGPGTIFVHDPENNPGAIFNWALSYAKASWVVHMLRHVMGDEVFFPAVVDYLGGESNDTYRSVVTEEFQRYMEDASGLDLEMFFQNWIYGQYYPTYKYTWTSTQNGSHFDVELQIEQLYIPSRQIFHMPIDMYFKFANGDTTIVIQNNQELQTYSFTFEQDPEMVQLDKDNWILKHVIEPVVNPTFDEGILLVNGVNWDVSAYTTAIKAAYADSIFTGDKAFTFWDIFPNPSAGYPNNMPEPVGTGRIPASELGKYCTVVWIGNNNGGDLSVWTNTSIWEYLQVGGNVLLLTRTGNEFLTQDMRDFLGITWSSGQTEFMNCQAVEPAMMSMQYTGRQNVVVPFDTDISRPDNILLFTETESFPNPEGIGVWGKPMDVKDETTGHMVFMSLRPYRIGGELLRHNMQTLLDTIPCNPKVSPVERLESMPQSLALSQNYPNPVHAGAEALTTVSVTIPEGATLNTTLRVYDALGRMVREINAGMLHAGEYNLHIDVSGLPAGSYNYTLQTATETLTRQMVVVK